MGMRAFLIRRILLVIPTLVGVTLLIFAVLQFFSPEQRAVILMSKPGANIHDVVREFGLDQPVWVQYANWMKQILRGDLGWSNSINMSVKDVILTRWPATAELVLFSAPIIILLGIYLGIKSAVHRDKPLDHATRVASIIGWSLPSFWFGTILLAIFWGGLHWITRGQLTTDATLYIDLSKAAATPYFFKYTGFVTIDSLLNGQLWITLDAIEHLILPAAVLIVIQIALIIRLMRSSMLESLNKPFVIMARAKGLAQNEVINKHARRTALIPAITMSGLLIAGMLNGLVITETIFGIPGLGNWAATAAIQLDIAAVLGFALFSGVIFVFSNLIVDILYAYVDPRIRLD